MNTEEVLIRIVDIVGSELCLSSEDGDKVYAVVAKALKEKKKVRLSFKEAVDLTTAFLNAAIGQLYNGEFSEEDIRNGLCPPDATPEQLAKIQRIVDRAKDFFKDPELHRKAAREAMEESA